MPGLLIGFFQFKNPFGVASTVPFFMIEWFAIELRNPPINLPAKRQLEITYLLLSKVSLEFRLALRFSEQCLSDPSPT